MPWGATLRSALAKIFPNSGFKALRPARIEALYYPTWFAHSEIQAKTWFSSDSDSEDSQIENAIVQLNDLYLPGFGMDFGRVLVREPPSDAAYARPFGHDLTHQYDSDVICLPFNITPFDLLHKAHDLSYKQATLNNDVRFDPGSLKINLAAAYPVLLPVYVAQYHPPRPWSPVTIILPAYDKPGAHYTHITNPSGSTGDKPRLVIERYMGDDDYHGSFWAPEEADMSAHVVSPRPHRAASEALSSWLQNKLQERNAPLSMVSGQTVDMDDLRVREWTEQEVAPVRSWMRLGEKLSQMKTMMKMLSGVKMDQVTIVNLGTKPDHAPDEKTLAAGLEGFKKAEAEKLRKLEESRDELTPQWWRQWEESQTARQAGRH
ncbi:hypothetical protein HYDPIDRAFT_29942 [Hydnomerulius pinastri MD-312]|uniref:Unplaced genomic scaffold scaffold_19, whole genome shotgun sequence n=1 Tax=Hydnomerulius pinastri MD-312 TaxID=994086 RepID=A0A0C9WD71_9AGAM|nr:hypothetical protein HYDPIDRAFT_29942 [Hydnomerulius pinastri MD-312]